MDTCGVGYVALGEADPVGNVTMVDSPGPEVPSQLDIKASSETAGAEAPLEMSFPPPVPGFEDSLEERPPAPDLDGLSTLEEQGTSLSLSPFCLPGLKRNESRLSSQEPTDVGMG